MKIFEKFKKEQKDKDGKDTPAKLTDAKKDDKETTKNWSNLMVN